MGDHGTEILPLVGREKAEKQSDIGEAASELEANGKLLPQDSGDSEAEETDPLLVESLGSFWHSGDENDTTLGDMYRSVETDKITSWWGRMYRFIGPGALVAVGYMDPGNWATDLAGGSAYNYRLLFVIVLSSLIAMFLQALSLRLGLVARLDLAQICRAKYSKTTSFVLWIAAEIGITACDLAEVIGSAVAMKLLFGLPLIWGVLITAGDVIFVIYLGGNHIRVVEVIVIALIAVIATCFTIELVWSPPDFVEIVKGALIPSPDLILDSGMLYIGIGILGATVMPHNLYLHSSVVQTRDVQRNAPAIREALSMCLLDSNVALTLAFFVNGAILILAASTFYKSGHKDVADLEQAYQMLDTVLGKQMSSVLFAVALLASGQQSTLTGTIAGQIVMEGFVQWRLSPAVRRLVTRLAAIVPAVLVVLLAGDAAVNDLLVLSQVVLSLQLSFAVFPLVIFTSDPDVMGEFVNATSTKVFAWAIAWFVLVLNLFLVFQTFAGT